jgi:hypothetical protein
LHRWGYLMRVAFRAIGHKDLSSEVFIDNLDDFGPFNMSLFLELLLGKSCTYVVHLFISRMMSRMPELCLGSGSFAVYER